MLPVQWGACEATSGGRSVRYLSGALLLELPSASFARLKCSHLRKEAINHHEDEVTWWSSGDETDGDARTGSNGVPFLKPVSRNQCRLIRCILYIPASLDLILRHSNGAHLE
jgi:hypothetical protein